MEVGVRMDWIVEEIFVPSKQFKVQIIKREDGLYSTKVYRWQEDCSYEYWNDITQGFSLIETEEYARKAAVEQLKLCSGELVEILDG